MLPSRVAHEIRTPLGVFMGALTQLESQCASEPKTFELARRAVAQLARLSDRLSLLARAAGGFADGLEVQPVTMAGAMTQAVNLVGESRRRRGVTVGTAGTEIDARVAADPRLLVAAIAELVDNAVRHATSRVDVSIAVRDGHAIVTVDDDGAGLDEERRQALFQQTPGHGRPGGLGIGTWLAAEIVGRFSGRVDAPVSPGVTRFELSVPTVRA
ncbi:MAG TPA: HAMP domain-containing sensor histidine kinase [Nannocystaceae bacterium]|nr:HAMP domain-containing sensor histidine kinase [Nannocystaceae bacterium]